MSVYSVKGKGWRYEFQVKGQRFTKSGYKTKKAARAAESERRKIEAARQSTPTRMGFLELVNKRLSYVQEYHSERHYTDHIYMARRWVRQWDGKACDEIAPTDIEEYLISRKRQTSAETANKELRYLRALFNFGTAKKRKWITDNPTDGVDFFPESRRVKYIPPKEDVLRVIMAADPDTQDYLWTMALTLGRMSEINRLAWEDIDFADGSLVLYTRKKKGGHETPRKVVMPRRLVGILQARHKTRDKRIPWVFWHRYWSRKAGEWITGPYKERKRIMGTLCKKAGVQHFRFHALRHFGAMMLEQSGVPITSIQAILGHEARKTTEIYLHSLAQSEEAAMEVLDDVYGAREMERKKISEAKGNSNS